MDTTATRAELRAHASAAPPASATASAAPAGSAPAGSEGAGTPRRGRSLTTDLTIIGVVVVLLIAAIGAASVALYRQLYSPTAFVSSYLQLLAEGRAVDALGVPGVALDATTMAERGLTENASEALLRGSTLAPLTDIEAVSEYQHDGVTDVTFSFRAGGFSGRTTFTVEQNGWTGVAPTWRFAQSPLAVIDLSVLGSTRFSINDFELDVRQVAPTGVEASVGDVASLLVLSPGLYSVSVSSAIAEAEPVNILADKPLATIPLSVQTTPSEKFVSTVQEQVDGFLDGCATQEVLQPTGCPFGFFVSNRIDSLPQWSIAQYPTVEIVPNDAAWSVPAAIGIARIEVDVRSLFDGSVRTVVEDVPFEVAADIDVLPDNTVSIRVNASEAGEG